MRATYEVWGDEYDDGFFPPRLRRAAGAGVTVVDDEGNQVHTFSVPSQEIALLTRDLLNHYFDGTQRTPHELVLWLGTLQSVAFQYGMEWAVENEHRQSPPPGWCHVHETAEATLEELMEEDKLYSRCFECGHVYRTAEELLEAYHGGIVTEVERARPAESADDVLFCPHCLHDF